jgi:hypothetical protein
MRRALLQRGVRLLTAGDAVALTEVFDTRSVVDQDLTSKATSSA